MKDTIEAKIVKVIFLLLPLFDAINGYLIVKKEISGVGSCFHLFFMIVLILLNINNGKFKVGVLEKLTFLLASSFLISVISNAFWKISITNIALERVSKILTTAMQIAMLSRLVKDKKISVYQLSKILYIQCQIIVFSVFIIDSVGIANYSYKKIATGKIGFYANLNELTIILAIFICIIIKELLQKFTVKNLLLFVMVEVDLIYTESKFAILTAIISLIMYILMLISDQIKKRRIRMRKWILVIVIILIPLIIIFIYIIYDKISASFFSRQDFLYSAYKQSGFLVYLSSGRIERINTLLIGKINNCFVKGGLSNSIHGIIYFLFGNGLSTGYYETLEMDMFDIYFLSGLLGFLVYTLYNLYIIKQCKAVQKKLRNYCSILFTVMASCFVGHVWTGGVAGVYFALLAATLMNSNSTENDKGRNYK